MKNKKKVEQQTRGWLPEKRNLHGIRRAAGRRTLVNRRVIILLSVSLICLLAVIVFLSSLFFLKSYDGWVYSREVERISFPGGAIIVRENRQSPSDKGYISISIEANITSNENLVDYIDSRTNALNVVLDNVNTNSTIEAVITFKDPTSLEDFASLCQTSIEKLGEYAIILKDEATSMKSTEVLWFPRPQEACFIQNLTSIDKGFKLEGIMAFECYIKAETARSLQSNPKVLLIDPLEDPQMVEVKNLYESKGFYVQLERPFFREMWQQYIMVD